MAFYQRLRDLKEDAGLTQKQVAKVIDVSINHYGKYERGETDIPFEKAITLANYYGVSLDYLAGISSNKANPVGKKETQKIMSMYQRLSKTNRLRIEERMLEMLENQK